MDPQLKKKKSKLILGVFKVGQKLKYLKKSILILTAH